MTKSLQITAPRRNGLGFTVIEMLVVAAMMSVLALAVLPAAEITQVRWKERELRTALWQIRDAIDAYKRAGEQRPGQGTSTASGYPKSLADLVSGPVVGESSPPRPFLRRIPRDPFAPDGVPAEQSWGLRSFGSPAHDPRAGEDVYDVYSLSPRVGSNGIPLRHW